MNPLKVVRDTFLHPDPINQFPSVKILEERVGEENSVKEIIEEGSKAIVTGFFSSLTAFAAHMIVPSQHNFSATTAAASLPLGIYGAVKAKEETDQKTAETILQTINSFSKVERLILKIRELEEDLEDKEIPSYRAPIITEKLEKIYDQIDQLREKIYTSGEGVRILLKQGELEKAKVEYLQISSEQE